MVQIQVPARICFFGDHQDYLGLPVIAGAIDRFIELRAYPIKKEEFQIDLKDLGTTKTISLDEELKEVSKNDYFRSAMGVLKLKGLRFSQGYAIEITGNIPLNAGLSSSSALVVAWIRFLVAVQEYFHEVSDQQIGQWAHEAEVSYFDQPGGMMDQYTIAQRGLLYIDTQKAKTQRLKGDLGALVIAESGIAKQTLAVLKNARTFQEKAIAAVRKMQPEFEIQNSEVSDYERCLNFVPKEFRDHWYAAIHNHHITKQARMYLSAPENNQNHLGQLMNEHQRILQYHIQNTPKEMIAMIDAARRAGAKGAKIIGSGGGGCMVAMVDSEKKEQVIEAFLIHGAKAAYEVNLVYPKA